MTTSKMLKRMQHLSTLTMQTNQNKCETESDGSKTENDNENEKYVNVHKIYYGKKWNARPEISPLSS